MSCRPCEKYEGYGVTKGVTPIFHKSEFEPLGRVNLHWNVTGQKTLRGVFLAQQRVAMNSAFAFTPTPQNLSSRTAEHSQARKTRPRKKNREKLTPSTTPETLFGDKFPVMFVAVYREGFRGTKLALVTLSHRKKRP